MLKPCRRLPSGFDNEGIPIKILTSGDDLGMESAAGAMRVESTMDKRIAKHKDKSCRIQMLTKVSLNATVLSGVKPMLYGDVFTVLSPRQRKQARTAARISFGSAGVAPCTTSLIWWRQGEFRDPFSSQLTPSPNGWSTGGR